MCGYTRNIELLRDDFHLQPPQHPRSKAESGMPPNLLLPWAGGGIGNEEWAYSGQGLN